MTMVGGENRHNDARSAIVEKNEIPIHSGWSNIESRNNPAGIIAAVWVYDDRSEQVENRNVISEAGVLEKTNVPE